MVFIIFDCINQRCKECFPAVDPGVRRKCWQLLSNCSRTRSINPFFLSRNKNSFVIGSQLLVVPAAWLQALIQ